MVPENKQYVCPFLCLLFFIPSIWKTRSLLPIYHNSLEPIMDVTPAIKSLQILPLKCWLSSSCVFLTVTALGRIIGIYVILLMNCTWLIHHLGVGIAPLSPWLPMYCAWCFGWRRIQKNLWSWGSGSQTLLGTHHPLSYRIRLHCASVLLAHTSGMDKTCDRRQICHDHRDQRRFHVTQSQLKTTLGPMSCLGHNS